MNAEKRAIIELNVAVFLFGFTAILGALITLNAVEIVWWRLLFTCASIICIFPIAKKIRGLDKKYIRIYAMIGIVVTLHWITFYGSIKVSNASTALICLATTAFFTSILEPTLMKQKINKLELSMGLLIIPGMFLVVQSSPSNYKLGIVFGIISAILASTFAIYNKKYIDYAPNLLITFIELGSGFLFITALLLLYSISQMSIHFNIPTINDISLLIILALACTTLAYVLALRALEHLSAFATNLTINLEPVYGIVLAYFMLNDGDELQPGFYIGSAIIIATLLIYFVFKKK